jgi:transcriptional regulator with XRE-family HTH domain
MNYSHMTNSAIAAELGHRLEQRRLERNIPQQQMADEIGITPKSYRQLIAGGGKLENMIAAMRALDCLDQLDNFLPQSQPSPLMQLKLKGKERKRARRYPITQPAHTEGVQEPKLDW